MNEQFKPYYISPEQSAESYLDYLRSGWYYNSERSYDSAPLINGPFRTEVECLEEIEELDLD